MVYAEGIWCRFEADTNERLEEAHALLSERDIKWNPWREAGRLRSSR